MTYYELHIKRDVPHRPLVTLHVSISIQMGHSTAAQPHRH
jgi:hypothetical protein